MKDFKPITAQNMTECLKTHPMHKAAQAVMADRLPDCIKDGVRNGFSVAIDNLSGQTVSGLLFHVLGKLWMWCAAKKNGASSMFPVIIIVPVFAHASESGAACLSDTAVVSVVAEGRT